jgi:hypothetical protein
MAELWTVEHLDHDGTVINTIAPENLQFTFNKKPPHTMQYDVSLARTDLITHDFIGAYRTNFHLVRGGQRIMGGLHTEMSVGLNDDFCTIFGKDWYHYIERRQYPYDPRLGHRFDYQIGSPAMGIAYETNSADVTEIIWQLAQKIFGRPNSLDISFDYIHTHPEGIVTSFSMALGDTSYFAQFIDTLSEVYPGFMYEVTQDKLFRIYSPSRYNPGVATDSSLAALTIDDAHSNAIIDLTFANRGPDATHLFGHGQGIGQNLIGSALGAPDNQAVYYRLDNDFDLGTATQAAGNDRTKREFSRMLNPQHEVVLSVDPDKIADFWTTVHCGSAIWINKDLVAHQIDSPQEVVQMDCTLSNEGDESVTFGLDQIYAGTVGVAEG